MFGRSVRVALVLTALIVPMGCTAKDDPVEPPAAGTAWEQALDAIGDDGSFSKDAALRLFALAFGDMPDVEQPGGTVGPIRSGTIALRAVLAHQSELTDAQRARIAEVRSVPDGSFGAAIEVAFTGGARPHGLASPAPPLSDADRNLLEAKARQLRQDIAARLGGDIPGRLKIVPDSRNSPDRAAGMADPVFTAGKYAGCYLHLYPVTFAAGRNPVTTLAHEMIHCFQAALSPDEASFDAMAPWAREGSAEWGSATLVGPDVLDTRLWQLYLTQPGLALFKKTYDAIGFYAHLEETGHSPWAAFRQMWSTKGNEAEYAALGATSTDFLDSWASSISRQRSFGSAWDTTGPGITEASAPRYPLIVGTGAPADVAVPAYAGRIYALAANTDLIDVSITGHGRIADGLIDETSLSSHTFCLRSDGCMCPDGSKPETATPLSGTGALMALTGGPDGAKGTVQGRNLDCTSQGNGASWHLDAPTRYAYGQSHTVVDAYTCAGLRGPWQASVHITHGPATTADPPLDVTVKFTWLFGRDGRALPVIGPYKDTVGGKTHAIVYYPVIQLDEAKGTITIVSMEGSEDGGQRIDLTNQLDRMGEPVPLTTSKPPAC